jgi:hypothetical protein
MAIPQFLNQGTGFDVTFSGAGAANVAIVTSDGGTRSICVRTFLFTRDDVNSGKTKFTWKDSGGNTLYGPFTVLSTGLGVGLASNFENDGLFSVPAGLNLLLYADQAGEADGGVTWFYR